MWNEVSGWLLGLLGALSAAGALVRRSTRKVRALQSQANLVQALEPGPGRTKLLEHLDRQAAVLADELNRASSHWSTRWMTGFERTWGAGVAVVIPAGVFIVAGDDGTAIEQVGSVSAVFGTALMFVGIVGWLIAWTTSTFRSTGAVVSPTS